MGRIIAADRIPDPLQADDAAAGPPSRPALRAGGGLHAFLAAVVPAGYVELRALPSGARRFVSPDDWPAVLAFLRQHVAREHCFFGVAARRSPGNGGGLVNCGALGALWTDIDFKTTPELAARRAVAAFPAPPSAVVMSGGGLHCYWLLVEPSELPADAWRVKAVLRGLARVLGGDLTAAEPARILRLPGSLNHKYTPPEPVVLECFEPARRYALAELEAAVVADVDASGDGHRPRVPPATPLPVRIPDGERNDVLYRYGRSLHARGVAHDGIAAALADANATRCEPPLPAEEVSALAAKAAEQAHAPGFRGATSRPRDGQPVLVRLADVEPEAVQWAWPGRLALGKLTVLMGDPGLGKSFIALDVAARFTTGGPWPDGGAAPPGSVVLLSAEDGVSDTIRPRVDALGGDPARVHVLQAVRSASAERGFTLKTDIAVLDLAIRRTGSRLVIVDPLAAYLGELDAHRDSEVRGVLAPLASLAERTGVAVLAVMHLTKDHERRAVYRALGSIAFTAAARILLAVGRDPNDEGRRLLVVVKCNVAPEAPALAYRLLEGRLEWEPEPVAGVSADALLGDVAPPEDPSARAVAEELIREALRDGPVSPHDVYEAARAQGISARTVRRAKQARGVHERRVPGAGKTRWEWFLP